jgi:hypothetical protein
MAALPGAKPPPLGRKAGGGAPRPGTPPGRAAEPAGAVFLRHRLRRRPDQVMTNQHVIEGCSRIFVRTADNRIPARGRRHLAADRGATSRCCAYRAIPGPCSPSAPIRCAAARAW